MKLLLFRCCSRHTPLSIIRKSVDRRSDVNVVSILMSVISLVIHVFMKYIIVITYVVFLFVIINTILMIMIFCKK